MSNSKGKTRIIPLGGLDEIGKNITVIETENDLIIVDCGMGFPENEQLGVDLVLPDFAYLRENKEKIRGVVITHGHEDHIGAIPYFAKEFSCPIFGSRFTIGLVQKKFVENGLGTEILQCVENGDVITLGSIRAEFITITHSIPGSFSIAVFTQNATILCSGDFKLDMTPVNERTDLNRLAALASKGVDVLLCDSTNAERPGYTKSEITVFSALKDYISKASGRVIVVSFASNIYRLQQVIDIAKKEKRKVAVSGRSMENAIDVASQLGYIKIPQGMLVDLCDISKYPDNKVLVLMTGSQGEKLSALARLAYDNHRGMSIKQTDTVIFSASQIPGNEQSVSSLIDALFKKCDHVIYGNLSNVHVSGHACQEELKIYQCLIKPKFFMPVHGEYWRQVLNKQLAMSIGIKEQNIVIAKNGDVIELYNNKISVAGTAPHGQVLVDGLGIGDVGKTVLKDREILSQDGFVVVIISINQDNNIPSVKLDIFTRGFVYEKESKGLLSEIKSVSMEAINICHLHNKYLQDDIKGEVRKRLSNYIYSITRRKPLIEAIIISVS